MKNNFSNTKTIKVYESKYIAYLATRGSKMRIMFADKLSKMIAHYENLLTWDLGTMHNMIFEIEFQCD